MSRTLFWYLFTDLLKIFFMAAGTLAGIMSFGGLLRPLTEQGLDIGQVGKMLTFLTPAMMTYSLPVAALFATTVVYGRLAADNELTACRAGGISYWMIGAPALVLGLAVAALSLALLCFFVPYFSLKVEQVIYSNLAKVVVNQIERNHELRFAGSSLPAVYAETARELPPDPKAPRDQLVLLEGPMVVTTVAGTQPDQVDLRIPREFYTAKTAVIRIHPMGDPSSPGEGAQVSIELENGMKFPRYFTQETQGGVDATTFGPVMFPSPIRENVKFMDIFKLVGLVGNPAASQRVQAALDEVVRADEEHAFLADLANDTNGFGSHPLRTGGALDEVYIISTDNPAPPTLNGEELIFGSDGNTRQVYLSQIQGEQTTQTAKAHEARVRAKPDEAADRMVVTIDLYNLTLTAAGSDPTERTTWSTTFDVPMSGPVESIRNERSLASYIRSHSDGSPAANHLNREQVVVDNSIKGELHSRVSFALSCPILVLMGCALGMMFKSGNFLNAFAVSFLPALLCITLNVGGQQTADHIPAIVTAHFLQDDRPLKTGLVMIWGGNAVVAVLAGSLILRLTRR